MMAFHKPKMYKSINGCCICKAKSSSSRFTLSGKYSEDFRICFSLLEEREGEICNACVLLVKRWRKLPKGSVRNWSHVVDARAGPGTRSFVRRPRRDVAVGTTAAPPPEEMKKHKHIYRRKRPAPPSLLTSSRVPAAGGHPPRYAVNRRGHVYLVPRRVESPLSLLMMEEGDDFSDCSSSSRSGTPSIVIDTPSFFKSPYWTREDTACGPIYHGEQGELVIDRRYAATALCPHSQPSPPALLPPQRFIPASAISLSPVESLIEAELQSLAAQQSSGATSCTSSSSFQSDDKSVDMEEHEEDEEEDIDFYCNESIEDLKQQHQHHADGSAASAAAVSATVDDLDEGFFDRPPSHGGFQSSYCGGVDDGGASKTRRKLMPFS